MGPEAIDWREWQFWLAVGLALENIAVGIYVWFSNRDKARDADMKSVKAEVQGVETRVTKLEAGSISHSDLSKVYDRMNVMAQEVSKLNGSIQGLQGAVELIHQHLLNSSGGKK